MGTIAFYICSTDSAIRPAIWFNQRINMSSYCVSGAVLPSKELPGEGGAPQMMGCDSWVNPPSSPFTVLGDKCLVCTLCSAIRKQTATHPVLKS